MCLRWILNNPKYTLIYCGSSFQSHGPAYLIQLLHTCARLHRDIRSFPWVFDFKFFLIRLRSNKLITNQWPNGTQFFHFRMFSLRSTRVGGRRPPTGNPATANGGTIPLTHWQIQL